LDNIGGENENNDIKIFKNKTKIFNNQTSATVQLNKNIYKENLENQLIKNASLKSR
jgi:hypothetical protein